MVVENTNPGIHRKKVLKLHRREISVEVRFWAVMGVEAFRRKVDRFLRPCSV
jgi:hypothetical protein